MPCWRQAKTREMPHGLRVGMRYAGSNASMAPSGICFSLHPSPAQLMDTVDSTNPARQMLVLPSGK